MYLKIRRGERDLVLQCMISDVFSISISMSVYALWTTSSIGHGYL